MPAPIDILILKILSEYDQPVQIPQSELARVCGASKATVKRACRRLRDAGKIEYGRKRIHENFHYRVIKK